jgi:Cu-processing system permease protein
MSSPEFIAPGALRAVSVVARATFAEAVRLRLAWFVSGAAGLLVAAAYGLRELHFGTSELRFLHDLGFGAVGAGACVVAVLAVAQLYFSDLDHRMVAYVLARPVSRGAWLAGKLAGVLAALALFTGALGLLVIGLLAWRACELGLELAGAELFRAAGMLWIKAAVVASAALFICAYAHSPLFACGAGLCFVLIGHLRPLAAGLPLEASARGLVGAVARLWPDLTRFDAGPGISAPSLGLIVYGFAYVGLLAGAAMLAFRTRDL